MREDREGGFDLCVKMFSLTPYNAIYFKTKGMGATSRGVQCENLDEDVVYLVRIPSVEETIETYVTMFNHVMQAKRHYGSEEK